MILLPRAAVLVLAAGMGRHPSAPPDPKTGDDGAAGAPPPRLEVHAVRLTAPVKIDGDLSDPGWQNVPAFTTFVERDPVEGGTPSQRTEVQVAYDDAALYVAATMSDAAPDSIVARLSRRDDKPNSDLFGLFLDPYHDKRSGYYFGLDAGGTLFDGTLYNDDWNDNAWDGVWEGRVSRTAHGWTAEMRIPFSQLRFHAGQALWGINFERDIARRNEVDFVVFTPKNGSGFVSRFVDLTGLDDIPSPHQVEILPYVNTKAEYIQHPAGDPFNKGSKYLPSTGVDFKVGLGSDLTLDGAVNPDFGQVEVDPAVVNLSDVETFYDEKRPFFLEGSSIFNFGRGGSSNYWSFNWSDPTLFYSRRIGRPPQGAVPSADFYDAPVATSIIGAAKLTGKLGDNWNIGLVNAVTAREFADLQTGGVRSSAEIEPLTYYGVYRAQKEFNEGRQGLGFMSTVVARNWSADTLRDQLNSRSTVFGLDGWTFLDQDKTWVLAGWGAASDVRGNRTRITALQQDPEHYLQRPDARSYSVDTNATSLAGYSARITLGKQRGDSFLNAALGVIDPRFDSDDLGFMWRTDQINGHIGAGYQWTTPSSWYRQLVAMAALFRSYDFDGDITWEGLWTQVTYQFLSFHSLQFSYAYNPQTLNSRRTRGGPVTLNPPGQEYFVSFQSDNTRSVVYQYQMDVYQSAWQRSWYVSGTLEVHPASNVSISLGPVLQRDFEPSQWVGVFDDPTATATFGKRYVFAFMNQSTLSANIRLNWTFTPRLSLQLFVQPLISAGNFYDFEELVRPRSYDFSVYGRGSSTITRENGTYQVDPDGSGPAPPFAFSDPNFNLKSLRGNAVLRWEYMPGSTIYFVWTQSRFQSDVIGAFQFDRSMQQLVDIVPDNVFMIKLSYWWNS